MGLHRDIISLQLDWCRRHVLILFQSSTWLTEKLSAEKYPEYKIYQQRVGKFLPKLTGPGWGEYLEAQKKAPKKK